MRWFNEEGNWNWGRCALCYWRMDTSEPVARVKIGIGACVCYWRVMQPVYYGILQIHWRRMSRDSWVIFKTALSPSFDSQAVTPPLSVNCVCIYLCKSESSATASIRWIWPGFTTHSGRLCPEATALRWVPPSFIYAFNYAFLFFFFSSPSAPIASETRRGKFNSFLEPGLYWVYWVRVTHTNIFFSCLSLISSSWQQQRHCMMPVL